MRKDYQARQGRPLGDGSGATSSYRVNRGQTMAAYIVVSMIQQGGSGQNCIQRITMTGTPTGGLHQLKLWLQKTSGLTFDCTAANVESALEALSSVGSGNVSCSGGPLDDATIDVEFVGDLASSSVPLMVSLFGKIEGGEIEILKDGFGYVAKLSGPLGSEEVDYECVRVFNGFSDVLGNLRCLYADTGAGDELVQVECVEE